VKNLDLWNVSLPASLSCEKCPHLRMPRTTPPQAFPFLATKPELLQCIVFGSCPWFLNLFTVNTVCTYQIWSLNGQQFSVFACVMTLVLPRCSQTRQDRRLLLAVSTQGMRAFQYLQSWVSDWGSNLAVAMLTWAAVILFLSYLANYDWESSFYFSCSTRTSALGSKTQSCS